MILPVILLLIRSLSFLAGRISLFIVSDNEGEKLKLSEEIRAYLIDKESNAIYSKRIFCTFPDAKKGRHEK